MIEVLEVLGGLALFLFGVRLLSGGMEKLAGNRLQDLVEQNRCLELKVPGTFGCHQVRCLALSKCQAPVF